MDLKLIILLLGLSPLLAYADLVNVAQNKRGSSLFTSQITGIHTGLEKETSYGFHFILPHSNDVIPQAKKQQVKPESPKVLPDLFNTPGTDSFDITGGAIKSVDLKERGEIDGAEIQFHFKQ